MHLYVHVCLFPVHDMFLSPFYSLLSEDNLNTSTLEMMSASFSRNFIREDHFRVGSTLVRPACHHQIIDTYISVAFPCILCCHLGVP